MPIRQKATGVGGVRRSDDRADAHTATLVVTNTFDSFDRMA